jgi:hypothetical protein
VKENERNVEEACCVCGGGLSTDDFDDPATSTNIPASTRNGNGDGSTNKPTPSSTEDPNDGGGGFHDWRCISALLIPVLVILHS